MAAMTRTVELIGAAVGEGAPDHRTRRGPTALRAWGLGRRLATRGRAVHWGPMVQSDPSLLAQGALAVIAEFAPRLAEAVTRSAAGGRLPLVVGGDHSCAVGTWSALAAWLRHQHGPQARLGLVWVDAHLDAHTLQTSESAMPHGMPLAALLGHGEPALTVVNGQSARLLPDDLVLIGPRSWEAGEAALLRQLGVRVIDGAQVQARGLAACLHEAVGIVSARTAGWGLSFDLDALDPREAPGIGSPVAGGLTLSDAAVALHGLATDPRFVGAELVEYNPSLDPDRITAAAAEGVLGALIDRRARAARRGPVIDRRAAATGRSSPAGGLPPRDTGPPAARATGPAPPR